jgi:hypothetical protein
MEEIKTMGNDFDKSTDSPDPIVTGKRTVIDGKVYEWDGSDWKLVTNKINK